MRRSEFLDHCSEDWGWEDLFDFASSNGLSVFENLVRADDLDSEVCADIRDATTGDYWYDIRDALDGIESGYDYYIRNGRLEYSAIDDDWDDYVDAIVREMDRDDLWDEEEDEDPEEDDDFFCEEDDDDDEEEEPEPDLAEMVGIFSLDELVDPSEFEVIREESRSSVGSGSPEPDPVPAEPAITKGCLVVLRPMNEVREEALKHGDLSPAKIWGIPIACFSVFEQHGPVPVEAVGGYGARISAHDSNIDGWTWPLYALRVATDYEVNAPLLEGEIEPLF